MKYSATTIRLAYEEFMLFIRAKHNCPIRRAAGGVVGSLK